MFPRLKRDRKKTLEKRLRTPRTLAVKICAGVKSRRQYICNNCHSGSSSMNTKALVVCGLSVLAGCSSKPAAEAPPPYNINFPMNEIMGDIIDPAAQILWHSAG